MKNRMVAAGIFVFSAIVLFSMGLYLIGTNHNAFTRHETLYTQMFNVNGVTSGLKVRVAGFEAGQVENIEIPERPSGQFRIKLQIDKKLRKLIREDSFVTIETDGLVGDKFVLIHKGSDNSQQVESGTTLKSMEPLDITLMVAKATKIIDQTSVAITDVQGRLNLALDAMTKTVQNTDGLVSDARHGDGTIGVLMSDRETAQQLKKTVGNAEEASANFRQLSVQAGQLVTDLQSRQIPAKLDDTVTTARHAAQQIDAATQNVNTTLDDALGQDRSGKNAAQNIRETLSNVNLATANIAEDTEALKHEFFFKGFFKTRGYYSLGELTPDEYRTNSYFQNVKNRRAWLSGAEAYTTDAKGNEVLSEAGERQIDAIVGNEKNSIINSPIVIEGYSSKEGIAAQMVTSRSRTILIALYLEKRFHMRSMDIGAMPLNQTPPKSSGKDRWDGACIVFLAKKK